MRLKNVLVVVEDLERSRRFYSELFGLGVVACQDGIVIMTEGLVLQERKIWESMTGKKVITGSHSCELYFEEADIESFAGKLEQLYPAAEYVHRLVQHPWGQKSILFYDPDRNLIHVGTP